MNKAMLTVGIILLSIIALGVINLIQSYTTGQELDYYLLKETTEAAMEDALDLNYYREGAYRMDKEKFAESFIRRFARSVDDRRSYQISFYDVNEIPPKASVEVKAASSSAFEGTAVDITTRLDMIIETNHKSDPVAARVASSIRAD